MRGGFVCLAFMSFSRLMSTGKINVPRKSERRHAIDGGDHGSADDDRGSGVSVPKRWRRRCGGRSTMPLEDTGLIPGPWGVASTICQFNLLFSTPKSVARSPPSLGNFQPFHIFAPGPNASDMLCGPNPKTESHWVYNASSQAILATTTNANTDCLMVEWCNGSISLYSAILVGPSAGY